MIAPRLSSAEAVSTARALSPEEVSPADPRLFHVDVLMALVLVDMRNVGSHDAWFVEWPDGSRGFVFLERPEQLPDRLQDAYFQARSSLEVMTLRFFDLTTAGAGKQSGH